MPQAGASPPPPALVEEANTDKRFPSRVDPQ
jgi:hypothetical protein